MKKWNVLKRLGSLLLALFLVLGMLPATHAHAADFSGGEKFYLSPGPWAVDGAWFAFYVFGGNGDGWASMTDSNGDGIYEGTAPAGTWTNIIFCRMNPAGSEPSWDYKWNQTADLVCDVNTVPGYDGKNNHYIITGWNANDGAWKHDWKIDDTSTCFCGAECDHFDSDMVEDKPTCVSNGWLRFTCRTCGYKWTSPGGNPEPENDAAHVWQKTGSGTRGVCEASYTCYNDPEHTKTVPFAAHSFTDSVCTNCGYGCDHIAAMADGVCTVCGWECDHHSWTEISGYATCYYCGIDAVAKVVDTYYLDIEEALAKAQETDGCTLTLYQNVSGLTKTLTVSKGNFTILGNSNTLSGTMEGPVLKITGGTVLLKSLKVENPSTAAASRAVEITGGNVTVRGGAINAGHSGIFIPLDSDPTVTLLGCTVTGKSGVDNNSTASTLNLGAAAEAGPTIQGTTYGVSSRGKVYFNGGSVSGEYGFYLVPGASVTLYDEYYPINATAAHFFIAGAPTGELNFRYAPSEGKYKIKATLPGTFAKPALSTVELDPAGFISVTDGLLLAKDGDNLILKQCGHENIESEATCKAGAICGICGAEVSAADPDAHVFDAATGKCGNGCGLEMAAASTTVGSTTTYYLTVQAALDAASQAETATVNLLRSDENVTGLTMMGGNVRLEMNGLTLKGSVSKNGILQLFGAKLSVVGGTVENTAADGYGIYAAYNESTHRYSTIDVDSSTVTGGDAGIVTYKAHVSLARGTVTGTRFGIAAQNSGGIVLESGTVRGDVGVCTSFYGGTITLGAEGTDGPTVYGQTCGIATNYDTTAYSGTIHCPEGIGIRLGGHYSGQNESAGAGLYLEGTPTIDATTDIYLDYEKSLVKSRYIQVNVELTDGAYSVDCQMDNEVIAMPGTDSGITLQRTWFTSANANKFVQHIAQGKLSLGPCAHGDKKAVQNEDGVTHDVFCNICQTTPEKDVPCSGGTATCKNKAVCTACGELYGELGDHIIDPDTGKCAKCGYQFAASLKIGSAYKGFVTAQEALNYNAGQPTAMKLWKDGTVTRKANESGIMLTNLAELDLNGHTLSADCKVFVYDNLLTVKDSATGGKFTTTDFFSVYKSDADTALTLQSGTLESTSSNAKGAVILDDATLTVTGGSILSTKGIPAVYGDKDTKVKISGGTLQSNGTFALLLDDDTATAELTGGTYKGGIRVNGIVDGDLLKLKDVIPEGYRLVDTNSTSLNKYQQEYAGDCAVIPCAGHTTVALSDNNGFTHTIGCPCGYGARTNSCSGGTATCKNKAVCTACGEQYGELGDHIIDPATGYCSGGCGTRLAVAMIEKNSTASYSADLAAAFAAVKDCVAADYARITLLKNVTLTGDVTVEGGVFDLDMMGKTIDAGEYELIIEGGKIQMEDGTITGKDKGTLRVEGGQLTIWRDMTLYNDAYESGLVGTLIVDGGTAILDGGTITSNANAPAVYVESGSFILRSGTAKHVKGGYALMVRTGEATLTGGTLSSAEMDTVYICGGTLKVEGTTITHGSGRYDVSYRNPNIASRLDFTNATGTKYTVLVDNNQLAFEDLSYNSAKHAVTSTDSDLSDGSYAKGSIVTLSCAHNGTTAAPNGDGTHKVTCSNCKATVAESEACSGGTATCIAKAECAKCEAEYGQLLEHAMDAATGKCKYDCGLLMAEAYVTGGNKTTYYLTFEEAFANTMSTHSLCLLKDATVESALRSVNMRELFLNGHTLTLDQGMTVDTLKLSGTGGTLKGGSDCEVLLQVTGDLELINVSVLAECDHAVNAATLTLREATLSSDRAEIYITEFPSSGPAIYFETPYNGSALRVEFAENMNPLGMLLAEGDYYLPEDQIEIFNEGYTVSHLPSDGTDGRALYVCADLADAQVKNAPFAITYGEDIQAVLPELTLLGRNLTKNIDYTLTYPTVTGVGTVNIIATGTSRYVGELKIPVTVNKATPKHSDFKIFSPADLVYNGQPKVPQIDTTRTGMGQWTVQYMDIEKSTLESNAVDAGTYQIVLNVAEGENYTDSTVTNPFWTFQITKADVTLRMQEPNTTTPYATSKPVQIIATGADGTILGAEVTLRMMDNGKEARKDEKKTVDSTGTATYENLSKKQNGELLKAGTYTVWASIAESKNYKAANFTKLGTYTITKADLTITKTSTGTSNKYGHNLFGIASVTGVTDDVNGLSIQLQLKNAEGAVVNSMTSAVSEGKIVWNWLNELPGGGYADAGEYTIVAKFDGNAIYEASETNLGTYTIVPTPATVTAADQTITLGESVSTDEDQFEVEGLLVGYRLTAITLTPSTDKVTASGEIIPMDAVIKRGDVDVTANYDITYVPGKLVIEPDSTPIDDLDVDTVTSDDAEDIQSVKEMMAAADSVKDEWNDITDKVSQLQERLADAAAAAESGAEDIVEEDLMFSHEEELEDAAAALEKALEDFGGNYTDEEKQAIQEELARIEFLLAAIEEAKPVKEMIDELPDPETIEPDDEDVIADFSAMLKASKELSLAARRPLSNMDKVQKIIDALISYEIIKGEGGKYTLGSSEGLSFTANGPVDAGEVKFLGIQVDGKDVAEDAYTVTSGSTIVALKAEYLNTLAEGEHTIVFNYDFMGLKINTEEASFQVVKKAAAPGGESGNPDTGDASQLPLWTGMAVIGLLGMAVLLCAPRKKGKYQR